MSLIACTDPCVYQKDGFCTLSRAVSTGSPTRERSCIHFLPRQEAASQEHRQGLLDVADRDEL